MDNNVNNSHSDSLIKGVAIICIWIAFVGVSTSLSLIILNCLNGKTNLTFEGHFAVFAAVANALLLYLTLKEQLRVNKANREEFAQKQFEHTFFNLLEYHRKIRDDLLIYTSVLNDNLMETTQKYSGLSTFVLALNDILQIHKYLCLNNYIGMYNENDALQSLKAIEDDYDRKDPQGLKFAEKQNKENILFSQESLKQIAKQYNITGSLWKDYNDLKDKRKASFMIFQSKRGDVYNQYIRSLRQLLLLSQNTEVIQDYVEIVSSQMSYNEIQYFNMYVEYEKTELLPIIKNTSIKRNINL